MTKKVFEGVIKYQSEDWGSALVSDGINEVGGDPEVGMFIRIQSWDGRDEISEEDKHREAKQYLGKKVRVTVEILEE